MRKIEAEEDFKIPLCLLILFMAIAVVFIAFPAKNILLDVFTWHLKQPETTQGLIEIGLVLLIQSGAIFFCKKEGTKFCGVLLIGALYLQNHQALLPLIAAIIYFEMIMHIGYALRNFLAIEVEKTMISYLLDFCVGVCLWGAFAIIISLLGFGTFNHLRGLTIVLFFISILKFRRPPLVFELRNFKNIEKTEQLLICFLAALILIQCAKSARAFDYDSLWYGLRPEQVLIGENSFYDNLGYLQWVNYFPKFIELFFAPLSNLGEYSFIYSCNIVVLIIFMVLVYSFIALLIGSSVRSLIYTILIFTIPVMSNMASTAKADLMTAFLIVFGGLFFYLSYSEKKPQYVFIALGILAVSLGGKISSYLYAFMIFVGGMLLVISVYKYKTCGVFIDAVKKKETRGYLIILLLGIFVLLGVTYRTYLLTGYPLYPFTVNFWKSIGFEGVYPFDNYFGGRTSGFKAGTVFDLKFYINHIFNLLFEPKAISAYRANHLREAWYSNFGIYFAILTAILLWLGHKKRGINFVIEKRGALTILCLPTIITLLFIAVFKFQYAQDGNYYLVPITIGIIYSASLFETLKVKANVKQGFYVIFWFFVILQFSIMFVSHTSWSWGTGKLKNNLTNSFYDSVQVKNWRLNDEGIIELEKYLQSKNYSMSRAVGLGKEQRLFELSTGYEDIVNSDNMTKGIFDTEENFVKYLKWAEINYIILPRDNVDVDGYADNKWKESYAEVWNVYNHLLQEKNVVEIKSEKYRMIDITDCIQEFNYDPNKQITIESDFVFKWTEGHYEDGWIAKESSFEILTGAEGNIQISLVNHNDEKKDKKLEIYVNNELMKTEDIKYGKNEIEVSAPAEAVVKCTLKSNYSFVPSNGDTRELSYIIDDIKANE